MPDPTDRQLWIDLRQGLLMISAAYRKERSARDLSSLEEMTFRGVRQMIVAISRHQNLTDPDAPRVPGEPAGPAVGPAPFRPEEPAARRPLPAVAPRGGSHAAG